MANQLESALVLALRSPLTWQAALDAPSNGTLTPVDPNLAFNSLAYAERDRQLQHRDITIGSAVLETAIEIADIWHYLPDHPTLQGPATPALPLARSEITSTGTNLSMVRHVLQTSIPLDAVRYADADLYGRDTLLYETLARACQVFTDPPIQPADPSNSVVSANGSIAWSLAEGSAALADVNSSLALNRELFKQPDRFLADRDNQLAAYVSRLAQVLKNPFAYALRLYVSVTGVSEREPEVYTLASDDGTLRTWTCEPALPDRNRFVYNIEHNTLQWVREEVDEVHVPQLYALSIPGIELGQTLNTLPQVPEAKDAQFWRQKAGQIRPEGVQLTDTNACLERTDSDVTSGGVMQIDAASLTVPDRAINFQMSGTVPAGITRFSALVEPNSLVEIIGAQNISDTSGTLGGADYAVNVASGSIGSTSYLVEGGDGIVYAGATYLPNSIFSYSSGTVAYAQVNASYPSAVRQYGIDFRLPLPPATWKFKFDYSNIGGTNTAGFGVKAVYASNGQNPVEIMQDTVPLPWSSANGQVETSSEVNINIADQNPFNLSLNWTYGDGTLHIRKLYFETTATVNGSYYLSTNIGSQVFASVSGIDKLPQVIQFEGSLTAETRDPIATIHFLDTASLPLRINQIQFQSIGTYASTPVASRFQGWRQECLDRAERVVQTGYNMTVRESGTRVPAFRDSGSGWNADATEAWMGFAEVKNPRLREMPGIGSDDITVGRQYEVTIGPVTYDGTVYSEGDKFYGSYHSGSVYTNGTVKQVGAFMKSLPGHIGQPALVPYGINIDSSGSVRSHYGTDLSVPVIVACQPWMIDQGIYVAQAEFWLPDYIGNLTVLTASTGTTEEPPLPPLPIVP